MIGVVALFVLWAIWPIILGVVGGVAIWWNGYDNAGVIFALACFGGQFFWARISGFDSGGHDSMSDKIAHFNKDGKLRGYSDKD